MKTEIIKSFISLWRQAAEMTKAANELKDKIRSEVIGSFFAGREGDPNGSDTVRIPTDAGTVLVSFTKSYRALDASERDLAAEIIGPSAKKHFKPSWTVELSGLTELEALEIKARFGDRAETQKRYVAGEAWHTARHSLPAEKLVELERALKIERVNVSVK